MWPLLAFLTSARDCSEKKQQQKHKLIRGSSYFINDARLIIRVIPITANLWSQSPSTGFQNLCSHKFIPFCLFHVTRQRRHKSLLVSQGHTFLVIWSARSLAHTIAWHSARGTTNTLRLALDLRLVFSSLQASRVPPRERQPQVPQHMTDTGWIGYLIIPVIYDFKWLCHQSGI